MVTININIEKKHLFIFCLVVGLVIGMFFVYAYKNPPIWSGAGASVPSNFGHSVDEINWSQTINKSVSIGGATDGRRLWVQSPVGASALTAAFVNNNKYGVAIGADASNKGVIQGRSDIGGVAELLLNPAGGDVEIGTNAGAAGMDLDVKGNIYASGQITTVGDISSNRKIYNSNACRLITTFTGAGNPDVIDVPDECINNRCLIVVGDFGGYITYIQGVYDLSGGLTQTVWSNSPGGDWAGNTIATTQINGDGQFDLIMKVNGGGYDVTLYDDYIEEQTDPNKWVGWATGSIENRRLYVCF